MAAVVGRCYTVATRRGGRINCVSSCNSRAVLAGVDVLAAVHLGLVQGLAPLLSLGGQ